MDNNYVEIIGKVSSKPKFHHESYGEKFDLFYIDSRRKSGYIDSLPCIISEKDINKSVISYGYSVNLKGNFRSHNLDGKLILYVFVTEYYPLNEEINAIYIQLNGYMCKKPILRKTPFGKEICDVILAVNRKCGKSDYIPCVIWNENAKNVSQLSIGTNIVVKGRLQSRTYKKKSNDSITEKVAYEVSVSDLKIL